MSELLIIIIYACLVIIGFQAVTRPDHLLSFLGVYLKEKHVLRDLNKELDKRRLDWFEKMQRSIKHGETDLSDYYDFSKKKELIKSLRLLVESEKIQEQSNDVLKRYNKKNKSWWWRILKPISKPISECIICMANPFTWGGLFVFGHFTKVLYFEFNIYGFEFPPILLFTSFLAIAGLNFIVGTFLAKKTDMSPIVQSMDSMPIIISKLLGDKIDEVIEEYFIEEEGDI